MKIYANRAKCIRVVAFESILAAGKDIEFSEIVVKCNS